MNNKEKAPEIIESKSTNIVAVIQKIKADRIEEMKKFFERAAQKETCIVIGHRLSEGGEIDHLHILANPDVVFEAAKEWGRKLRVSAHDASPKRFMDYAVTEGCEVIVNNVR